MSSRAYKLKKIPRGALAGAKSADIFLAGVGAVGGALIGQLNSLDRVKYDLNVIGFCNSTKVKWRGGEITTDELYGGRSKNWTEIIEKLKSSRKSGRPLIFVDATGSREVADLYLELLESSIHIVTPSKIANTLDQSYYEKLKNAARTNSVCYNYETTVGAGLPVIQAIENLLDTGDEIIEVSGVVSGTMTYLFDQLEKGVPFSRAVVQARSLGYAEPDPRDDLSGEDVARKFLIVARTCGLEMEREEISVESLIPEKLQDKDARSFLSLFSDYDGGWTKRITEEKAAGRTLRYTGVLRDGEIRVGIRPVSIQSPIGRLTGTNNLIQIKSRRYHDQPLIIMGPGAGKEITAAGLLADIQKILREIQG
ncbi:MAG: hypothetical protein WEC12_02160 [Balneolaceae bacterium]